MTPSIAKLWGMSKIDAPQAWERTVGSPGVVLAVLDTGVDYRHEDLAANMWRNPGEIPGNGIDDDGNGFVDDVYGYDFAADRSGNNDSDPMDIDSHGTHVAGTMAAVGNNGIGVCGVAWNVRIMALKGFRPDLHIYDSDSIEAIEYAVLMKRDYRRQPGGHQRLLRRQRRKPAAEGCHRRRGRPGHRHGLRRGQRGHGQRCHAFLSGQLRPAQHHCRGRDR